MVDKLYIAGHALSIHMLTLFSINDTLLLRCPDWSTNLSDLLFNGEMAPPWLKHLNCVLFLVHEETNVSYCPFKAKQ